MTNDGGAPTLSVVVVSFNRASLLERCLMALERQTVRDGIEVLVVEGPSAGQGGTDDLKRRFPWMRWVSERQGQTVPQLRSLGIAQSRGEVVALLEDDCVAPEAWCYALLNAHRAPCGAIGGAIEPGGYGRVFDWAMYFFEYARFMQPVPAGPTHSLPGTNVSYKRAALAELAQEWAEAAEMCAGFYEVFVHRALNQRGYSLGLDPALVVYNVNSWAPSEVLVSRFHHGRSFAAMRVAKRPFRARMPFLAIAMLLPLIQVIRIMKEVLARRRHIWKAGLALPWILLLSVSWSFGEFAGYLLGPGESLSRWR